MGNSNTLNAPQIGDKVIAKESRIMDITHEQILTRDNEYIVIDRSSTGFYIIDDEGDRHHFSFERMGEFFNQ